MTSTANADVQAVDVAVLDDDPDFVAMARLLIERHGHMCRTFTTPEAAFQELRKRPAEVLLLDYQLDEVHGTDLVAPLRETAPEMQIIFVTAHSSPEIARAALQSGAFDFLTKPLDEGHLIASIAKARDHASLVQRVRKLEDTPESFEGIVGASAPMQTVFRIIDNVSPTDVTVMIRGESGTGKELVARAVHQRSQRREGPFVALNMAALPESLVESTLFGHEKGAFTDAKSRATGACEEAAGGTLFLDEICEMPIALQAKVLRFLQEGVFRRIGGTKDIHSDARIVSATNKNPLEEVREGRFREDLFYRLNVVPVELPALRDRDGDVQVISERALAALNDRHGSGFDRIEPAALQLLRRYDWPGNVRELLHVLERIVVLNEGSTITAAMLPAEVAGLATLDPEPADAASTASLEAASEDSIVPLDELERRAIEHALRVFAGSVPKASRALRVSQATIYRKLKTYGLDRNRFTS